MLWAWLRVPGDARGGGGSGRGYFGLRDYTLLHLDLPELPGADCYMCVWAEAALRRVGARQPPPAVTVNTGSLAAGGSGRVSVWAGLDPGRFSPRQCWWGQRRATQEQWVPRPQQERLPRTTRGPPSPPALAPPGAPAGQAWGALERPEHPQDGAVGADTSGRGFFEPMSNFPLLYEPLESGGWQPGAGVWKFTRRPERAARAPAPAWPPARPRGWRLPADHRAFG